LTLLDDWLPDYRFSEHHDLHVDRPVDRVYDAIFTANLARSRIVRALLAARGMRPRSTITLEDMTDAGFVVLDERRNDEIVIGVVGRFWTIRGGLERVDAAGFRDFSRPGYAKAATNFLVGTDGTGTRLSTETRVRCTDRSAERAFGRYWRLIGPFSGIIRQRWLATIAREARSR